MKNQKREILISVFVLFLIFCCAALVFSQEDYTRDEYRLRQKFKVANSIFEKGKKQFLKGDMKKAKMEFLKCIQTMPEHADASFFLAQIAYKNEDLDKALTYITKAKEDYRYIIKLKLNQQQQYFLKLQEQRQVVEQEILNLRGKLSRVSDTQQRESIKASIGRKERDLSIIDQQLREPVPDEEMEEKLPADYHYVHGNILFQQKKFEEAFEQYQETIASDPGHGNAHINLANLYYMAKQYQKAQDHLSKAEENGAEVNPKFKKAVLKALENKKRL
jgi:tetratricopeptide (TPR) repeat protein